jgi:energy-coupling factor transporter ATP-binding protein EcfA2
MPGKKRTHDPAQLSLSFELTGDSQVELPPTAQEPDRKDTSERKLDIDGLQKQEKSLLSEQKGKIDLEANALFLPSSYEDIIKKVGKDQARLADLIFPVEEFEKEIIKVLANISTHGHLLFLYGASGSGKSTFTHSLEFQKHIDIQEIVSIDSRRPLAGKSVDTEKKLHQIIERISSEADTFFESHKTDGQKLCIIIEFLETLSDADRKLAVSFFRDLNSVLRSYPILIIWPVTVREDLERMQELAKHYSSSMFDRKIPFIHFTGPPLGEYPEITKKTISFFNNGKTCYDFQINDDDLIRRRDYFLEKPKEKHLIREYLLDITDLWIERTEYHSQILKNIPKPTEVWFVFSYPGAENTVTQFSRQNPANVDETWNAEYNPLQPYIQEHAQRAADWPPGRLTMALSTRMLTTKILFLPTNALIGCICAYSEESGIEIDKKEFLDKALYNIPKDWLQKSHARGRLVRTPLFLQIEGSQKPTGKRRSGKTEEALNNARQAFEKINFDISSKRISDQPINKAICLALQDLIKKNPNLDISLMAEARHPYLNVRPDITIETENKIICLEFCYTNNNTPGFLADYVLRKLNVYMKQLEMKFDLST